MSSGSTVIPVILSGGAGTRLWPLSRRALPKQLLALHGDRTMMQQTVLRVSDFSDAPFIICNEAHRFLVAQQMNDIGAVPRGIVLEPEGRNTGPAAAIAALLASEIALDSIVVLLPSDHVIASQTAFENALRTAIRAAQAGYIVTFGIVPKAPETGYGYIEQGDLLPALDGVYAVRRFVEKPDVAAARRYLSQGGYSWNSGMFVFRADTMLGEMAKCCPDLLSGAREALRHSSRDPEFVRLNGEALRKIESISIDYSVMERTRRAAVVRCDVGWSDVGSWSALWALDAGSDEQNVFHGDVIAHNSTGSYVHSEHVLTTLVGVKDLVVVTTADAVLVMHKSHGQDVREIVDGLKQKGRVESNDHVIVQRPWGSYQTIGAGPGYQVKRIIVSPGGRLSLQMHHKRSEHWVVVEGIARVTCNDQIFDLSANESTFIPLGAKHRLENMTDKPLHLIEVQCGSYLGEDDIVRFDDIYGRVPAAR